MTSKFAGLAMAIEATARLTIIHPVTGQPIRDAEDNEAYIDMLYAQGSIGSAHDRAVNDKRARLIANGGRYTQEMSEADANEKLAKLTKAWRLISLTGEPIDIPCTIGNARDLFNEPALGWMREQAIAFAVSVGNFQAAP